jgi:hypothetical protein
MCFIFWSRYNTPVNDDKDEASMTEESLSDTAIVSLSSSNGTENEQKRNLRPDVVLVAATTAKRRRSFDENGRCLSRHFG